MTKLLLVIYCACMAHLVMGQQQEWRSQWCETWQLAQQRAQAMPLDALTDTSAMCPACRSAGDMCNPLDGYGSDPRVCTLPGADMSSSSSQLCGAALTVPLVTADWKSVGSVTVFQTPDMELVVTFQVFCPYMIRPVQQYPAGFLPFATSLALAYADMEGATQGTLQYVDAHVGATSPRVAPFTCTSIKLQLSDVCEPHTATSLGIHTDVMRTHGCACVGNFTQCPVVDLSQVGLSIALTPKIYAVQVNEQCQDAAAAAAAASGPVLLGTPATTGPIVWQVRSCSAPQPTPTGGLRDHVYHPTDENETGSGSVSTETGGTMPEQPAPVDQVPNAPATPAPGITQEPGNANTRTDGSSSSSDGIDGAPTRAAGPSTAQPTGSNHGHQQHTIVLVCCSAVGGGVVVAAAVLLFRCWRQQQRRFRFTGGGAVFEDPCYAAKGIKCAAAAGNCTAVAMEDLRSKYLVMGGPAGVPGGMAGLPHACSLTLRDDCGSEAWRIPCGPAMQVPAAAGVHEDGLYHQHVTLDDSSEGTTPASGMASCDGSGASFGRAPSQ